MSKDRNVPFAFSPKPLPVIAIRKKEVERKVPKNAEKWAKVAKIACFWNENPCHFDNSGPIFMIFTH